MDEEEVVMFIPIKSMKSLFRICLPEDLIGDKLSDGASILIEAFHVEDSCGKTCFDTIGPLCDGRIMHRS